MAYSTANLHETVAAGHASRIWLYDGTDAAATVLAAGYISDSYDRGMKAGDLVFVRQFTTSAFTAITTLTMHVCTASVNGTGATLSAILTGGTSLLNTATASNPLVTSDTAAGYAAGSTWYNTSTQETWVCGDATAGAAVWIPTRNEVIIPVILNTSAASTPTWYFVAPFKYKVLKLWAVEATTVASADLTITFSIATTAITNGAISAPQAGSGAGVVVSATPTALNTGAAGDMLKAVVSGAGTGTISLFAHLVKTM